MLEKETTFKGLAEEGIRLAREGRYNQAILVFDTDICTMLSPAAMSYYALSLAIVEKSYDRAVSLCVMAAEKEFFNQEIYLNLGKILLANGRKAKAVKAFRRGLQIDKTNADIIRELRKLGLRRKPIVSWLPRQSSINMLLGKIAGRIG